MRFIFSLLILAICHTSGAQTDADLRSMSDQQLQNLKKQAIENNDFLKADIINKEIISRKTPADWRRELDDNLKIAVDKEDYALASQIKEKIKSLDRLEQLDRDLKEAVSKDDFARASQIKMEKEEILLFLAGRESGVKNKINQSIEAVRTDNSGTVTVIFEFPQNGKKTGFFIGADILIDGVFYGYFDKKNSVKVKNLPAGNHVFEFHLTGFPANEKRAFYSKESLVEGSEYVIRIKNFSPKEERKFMKKNMRLSREQKMAGDKVYDIMELSNKEVRKVSQEQEFGKVIFPTTTITSGTAKYLNLSTNFSGYKKPENVDKFFALNLQEDFTVPVKDGFILGGGFGFSLYNYSFPIKITRGVQFFDSGNDFTSEETIDALFNSYAFNANFLFGYQLELTEFFTIQSYISAGPGIYIGSSSTPIQTTSSGFSSVAYDYKIDYTSNSNVSFGGFWGTKAFYFFNKKQLFGISGGLAVGFSGGVGGNVGIVVGTFKPKYRNKYYSYAN